MEDDGWVCLCLWYAVSSRLSDFGIQCSLTRELWVSSSLFYSLLSIGGFLDLISICGWAFCSWAFCWSQNLSKFWINAKDISGQIDVMLGTFNHRVDWDGVHWKFGLFNSDWWEGRLRNEGFWGLLAGLAVNVLTRDRDAWEKTITAATLQRHMVLFLSGG